MKLKRSIAKHRRILWVDDEFFSTREMVNYLEDLSGYKVQVAETVGEALDHVRKNPGGFDAAVIDVMMPPGDFGQAETRGGYQTGLVLARHIRELEPRLPILAVTAGCSSEVKEWFSHQSNMSIMHKTFMIEEIVDVLLALIDKRTKKKRKPKIFIVHGHDDKAKLELKNFLQNSLDLGEAIILHEQPDSGRTIIEKFEHSSVRVDVVFVLLTPDDVGVTLEENLTKHRARQNVIFEMGYFFGRLQRTKGQVILLHRGKVELPSDITGVVYIDITNGIEAAGEKIRRELISWL